MRVSRERFTVAYVSLSLPPDARALSLSLSPSLLGPLRVFHLACSLRLSSWALSRGPYQRVEGSDASAPSTKIAGGPRAPSLRGDSLLSRHPPQWRRTRLRRIIRSPAAGDTLRRFRSLNTVPPPP